MRDLAVLVLFVAACGRVSLGQPSPTAAPTTPQDAYFEVVQSIPTSACTTNLDRTCITDGAGDYGSDERCTYRVLRQATLAVTEWGTETRLDHLTVNGVRFSGSVSVGLTGVTVAANSNITWLSDGSVERVGYTICGSDTAAPTATPTAAPTLSPSSAAPTTPSDAYFVLVQSTPTSACETNAAHTCITDGTGEYADNERCTYRVLRPLNIAITEWNTEAGQDTITINQVSYSGSSNPAGLNGLALTTGTLISWSTDTSLTRAGYTLCGTQTATPTAAPTVVPSSAPSSAAPSNPSSAIFELIQSTPTSACETNAAQTCITDGAGDYDNRERCSWRVLQSGFLAVVAWNTEQTNDRMTIGNEAFSGSSTPAGLNGRTVAAGTIIEWQTDNSVTESGYTVCGSTSVSPTALPTNLPTQSPTTLAPTHPPSAFFTVTQAVPSSACVASSDGSCITDGPGNYAANERCTISVVRTGTLVVTEWDTELNRDMLTINGVQFSATSRPDGVVITAGSTIAWTSDHSIEKAGFTVCGVGPATPTSTPMLPPSLQPTANTQTAAPTAAPTTPPTASPVRSPTSAAPTAVPSTTGTGRPSPALNAAPTASTSSPTSLSAAPTDVPTAAITVAPASSLSLNPTSNPTSIAPPVTPVPTTAPSPVPTTHPPSAAPTMVPTRAPDQAPTPRDSTASSTAGTSTAAPTASLLCRGAVDPAACVGVDCSSAFASVCPAHCPAHCSAAPTPALFTATSSSEGASGAPIAIIAVAIVGGLLILATIGVICHRRSAAKSGEDDQMFDTDPSPQMFTNPTFVGVRGPGNAADPDNRVRQNASYASVKSFDSRYDSPSTSDGQGMYEDPVEIVGGYETPLGHNPQYSPTGPSAQSDAYADTSHSTFRDPKARPVKLTEENYVAADVFTVA